MALFLKMQKIFSHISYLFSFRQLSGNRHVFRFVWRYLLASNGQIISIYLKKIDQKVYFRKNSIDLMSIRVNHNFNQFMPCTFNKEAINIVDAGAFIGDTALILRWLYPKARICSIEPDKENQQIFKLNTQHDPGIKLVKAAVWYNQEAVVVTDPLHRADGYQVQSANNNMGTGCSAMTIPEIMIACEMDFIHILKLDIEGAELDLFTKGSLSWLENVGVIVLEIHEHLFPGIKAQISDVLMPLTQQHLKIRENDIFILNQCSKAVTHNN